MNRPSTYNGGCCCEECDNAANPPAPTDHLARLEADGDIWPTTEGV